MFELVVPNAKRIPKSIMFESVCKLPLASDGAWLFECGTAGAHESLLGTFQRMGCAMPNFEKHYELGSLLGTGSFAKVFYAEHLQTGLPVAAKIVCQEDPKDAALMKEVCMLRRACHPSVLRFLGLFIGTDPIGNMPAWIIITEFVGGGELFTRVRENGPLPEPRAASIAAQLLSALTTLHSRGIVHRDIKTENVILADIERDEVKLVDFGLAAPVWDAEAMITRCGTPGYVAPEVLRSEKYGCKVDCFSVGVLLYILLVGQGPFRGRAGGDLNDMLVRNMRGKIKMCKIEHLSQEAQDLLLCLLDPNPALRPMAAESLQHPWFASFGDRLHGIAELSTDVIAGEVCQNTFTSLCVEAQDRQEIEDMMEDLPTEAEISCLPKILRSQTPIWADMQEALTNLRACGASPRTTMRDSRRYSNTYSQDICKDSCMPGERLSKQLLGGRLSGLDVSNSERLSLRLTGDRRTSRIRHDGVTQRTSDYFTHLQEDPRCDSGRVSAHKDSSRRSSRDKVPSFADLRDLAECDVWCSSENHRKSRGWRDREKEATEQPTEHATDGRNWTSERHARTRTFSQEFPEPLGSDLWQESDSYKNDVSQSKRRASKDKRTVQSRGSAPTSGLRSLRPLGQRRDLPTSKQSTESAPAQFAGGSAVAVVRTLRPAATTAIAKDLSAQAMETAKSSIAEKATLQPCPPKDLQESCKKSVIMLDSVLKKSAEVVSSPIPPSENLIAEDTKHGPFCRARTRPGRVYSFDNTEEASSQVEANEEVCSL